MSPSGTPLQSTLLPAGGEHVTAVLLAGHSNSGKTPLGRLVERDLSQARRRFVHFDFGQCLREVIAGNPVAELTPDEVAYIHSVMNGQLLDDEHFGVAEKLLAGFLHRTAFEPVADTLLLNGLPRHAGQARDLARAGVKVSLLVLLRCDPDTALRRMNRAARGRGHEDRRDRHDNTQAILRRKCESFDRDTMPMIKHFREKNVRIVTIDVRTGMTPGEMVRRVRPALEGKKAEGQRGSEQ